MSPHSAMYLKATQLVSDLHNRASFDVPALLREVIDGAVTSVPGACYGGVTVGSRQHLSRTAAASHRYPVQLDEIENRTRQGPSLTAARLQEAVLVDDLADDDRWPVYRGQALARTPVRSIMSLPMFKEGGTTATLSFYAETTHAFDGVSIDLGSIFATHTALVWNMMRRDQQFRAALVSRDVIGQAKGMIMERLNIDADEAFAMLKTKSQHSNTPIAHVAQHVVVGKVWPPTQNKPIPRQPI